MNHHNNHDSLSQYREASWMRSFGSGMSTISDQPVFVELEARKSKKSLAPLLLFAVILTATFLTGAFGDQELAEAVSPIRTDFQLALFGLDKNECLEPTAVQDEVLIARNPLYDGVTELRPGGGGNALRYPIML